jgi:hypothetical protein
MSIKVPIISYNSSSWLGSQGPSITIPDKCVAIVTVTVDTMISGYTVRSLTPGPSIIGPTVGAMYAGITVPSGTIITQSQIIKLMRNGATLYSTTANVFNIYNGGLDGEYLGAGIGAGLFVTGYNLTYTLSLLNGVVTGQTGAPTSQLDGAVVGPDGDGYYYQLQQCSYTGGNQATFSNLKIFNTGF